MALSNELISQFAKLVKEEKKPDNGTVVYGKIIVDSDGQKYVQLDGSDEKTPITEKEDDLSKDSSTTYVQNGDRVSVMIKNHTATVTGNVSSPASNKETVTKQIQEYDILVGEKITASEAYIKKFMGDEATLGKLEAAEASITDLIAKDAEIEDLIAGDITVTDLIATKIDASVVEANYAKISILEADYAKVRDLEAYSARVEDLETDNVTINNTLDAHKATIDNLNVNYANIDFSNIKMAAVEELFTKSGIIKDLVVGDTSITGELVGVTIKGDLVEAGTLKADKLVVKGSDGLFYKLNVEAGGISAEEAPTESLHGSVITAKSITAEKVSVKDLVAFGATIGGFHITDESIYSGVKASADNTTRGVHMSSDGQIAIGDDANYLRYYRASTMLADFDGSLLCDGDGHILTEYGDDYKFEIYLGNKSVETSFKEVSEQISNITVSTNGINAEVQRLTEIQNGSAASFDERLKVVEEKASVSITEEAVNIAIEKSLSETGASKVVTKTGYEFTDDGMIVQKSSNPEMKTQITEDGMEVSKSGNVTLKADNTGVDAVNLKASTYLIIGTNSRFQDYKKDGKKRTACFWIGG